MKFLILIALAAVTSAAVVQNLESVGGKASATANSNKGDDTNLQTLNVQGGELGVGTASVNKGNATGTGLKTGAMSPPQGAQPTTMQKVNVSGNKAVGTAKDASDNGGSTFQQVGVTGGELAIASAEKN